MQKCLAFRSRTLLFHLAVWFLLTHLCDSRAIQNAGASSNEELSTELGKSSHKLQQSLYNSAAQIRHKLMSASQSLEQKAKAIYSGESTASKELDISIRESSLNLRSMANLLGQSMDKGAKEMAHMIPVAVRYSKTMNIKITEAVNKAGNRDDKQTEEVRNQIKKIGNDLVDYTNQSLEKLGKSFKYIGDGIMEQFDASYKDMLGVDDDSYRGLSQAVQELKSKWEEMTKTNRFMEVNSVPNVGSFGEVESSVCFIALIIGRMLHMLT